MHTVGTISYGNHIADATGRLIGIAHPPRDLSGVDADDKAAANARLWAGSPDMEAALQALKRNGCLAACFCDSEEAIEAKRKALAAIEKATVAATVKAAA